MSINEIILDIIRKFFNSESENSAMHFSFPGYFMDSIDTIPEKDVTIINLEKNFLPFKPFMEILSLQNPDEDIIRKNTYSLHNNCFLSYFSTGFAEERKDIVILEEIFYEQKRFIDSIGKLLKELAHGNYIIKNAQLLSKEAIEIIEIIEEQGFPARFIFCYDNLKFGSSSECVTSFLQKHENSKNYFEISDFEEIDKNTFINEKPFISDFNTIYTALHNSRMFFELNQARFFCKLVEENLTNLHFTVQENRKLYLEMGLTCLYAGKTDEAIFFLTNITEDQDKEHEKDGLTPIANFYLCQVLFAKNDNISALKYAQSTMKQLENKKESHFYALAQMMDFIVTERSGDKKSVAYYYETIDCLEKHGLVNNKNYTSLIIPWILLYDIERRQSVIDNISKAQETAEMIGNQFGVSIAYHWKGIVFSQSCNFDEAYKWYIKCNDLRTELGQFLSVIKIRNGMSYEFAIKSMYKTAYDLINTFIQHIFDTNDYPEIVITLANVGRTLYFTRQFELAYEFFNKIQHFLYLFDFADITYDSFVPEYNDILTYRTLIEVQTADKNKTEFTRQKITLHNLQYNGKPFSPVENILRYFLKAILILKDGHLKEALKEFKGIEKKFADIASGQEHRLVYMYLEYAIILKNCNYIKESETFAKKGFALAKEKNLSYYLFSKENPVLDDYENHIEKFDKCNISLDVLEQKAEHERLINRLHKKLRDRTFLNRVMFINTDTDKKYAVNFSKSIFDYLMAEAVYIAEKKSGKWEITASIARSNLEPPNETLWEHYIKNNNSRKTNSYYDAENHIIFSNLSKFDFIGALIIELQPNALINSHELNTIDLAFNNAQAQLVVLKQNEKLQKISNTDKLSTLQNRRALEHQLAFQSELITRYKNKSNANILISISFIDLDNFKYYNDTFGHELGDLLIAKFSQLLKKVYRKVDYIYRYGGDEFVVLLTGTNSNESKRAAERLHESLAEEGHFLSEVENYVGRPIEIPKNRLLNFTCGICSNIDIEDPSNMNELLYNADHALYYAKRKKKSSVILWSNVKEILQNECYIARSKRKR